MMGLVGYFYSDIVGLEEAPVLRSDQPCGGASSK